jgi:hypothetical protein
MKDDYLRDGSGETDPEIERLEGLLGSYRSERPAPELPATTTVVPFRPRRATVLLPYAAAAAVAVLTLSVGLWWIRHSSPDNRTASAPPTPTPTFTTDEPRGGTPPGIDPGMQPTTNGTETGQPAQPGRKLGPRTPRPDPAVAPISEHSTIAPVQPAAYKPLVDVATAGHLEQAELLLRSFRNTSADDADSLVEVAFDAKQSRDLLDQNALLRRAAAGRKNIPMDQLLGDLEPYLLDIANLGDRPTKDDVREIQQRIDRHDVISDLELYSSNRPAQGF